MFKSFDNCGHHNSGYGYEPFFINRGCGHERREERREEHREERHEFMRPCCCGCRPCCCHMRSCCRHNTCGNIIGFAAVAALLFCIF